VSLSEYMDYTRCHQSTIGCEVKLDCVLVCSHIWIIDRIGTSYRLIFSFTIRDINTDFLANRFSVVENWF